MAKRLYTLLEIHNMIFCLHFLYGKKFRISIHSILLVCSDTIIFELINVYSANRSISWLVCLLVFIYTVVEFGIDKRKLIVSNMLEIIILSLVQMFAGLFIVILQLKFSEDDIMAIGIQCFVLIILLVGRNILHTLFEYVLKRNPVIIGAGIGYFIALIYGIESYKEEMEISAGQFLFLLIFGSLICILAFSWQKEREISFKKEMDLQMHELYDDSFKKLIDTIRGRQHEYHNHIQAIISMHYTIHTYEELVKEQEKYCASLVEDNEYYYLLNGDWPVLTGFLYSKFMEANTKGIKIDYSVAVNGRNTKIPEFIMIEILGILIDNAVEEVEKDKKPIIYISIEEKEQIIIDICNPVENISYREIAQFFEKGYSSKTGHAGLGLSKITEYGESYGFEQSVEKRIIDGRDCFAVIIKI